MAASHSENDAGNSVQGQNLSIRPSPLGKQPITGDFLMDAISSPYFDMNAGYDLNESVELNVLCQKCLSAWQRIPHLKVEDAGVCDEQWPRKKFYLPHYEFTSGLYDSAKNGCHMCTLLWQMFRAEWEITTINPLSQSPYRLLLMIWEGPKEVLECLRGFLIEAECIKYTPSAMLPVVSTSSTSAKYLHDSIHPCIFTASDDSFKVAKTWVDDCLNHHRSYQGNRNDDLWLPTRLIDVGDGHSRPLLCLSAASGVKAANKRNPYLTLSYCWGKTAPILNSTNIEALCKDVHVESLPRTFQDTITITRRLGYRYLWIDSLCILQDSQEDWRIESALMHKVYVNSALTIAALWGKDGDDGCFARRNPVAEHPCKIPGYPGKELYLWYGLSADSVEHTRHKSLLYLNDLERPLQRRAWAFQEWLVSPRTLYYGPHGLHWECGEGEKNEACHWDFNIYDHDDRSIFRNFQKTRFRGLCARKKPKWFDFQKSQKMSQFETGWHSILEAYTECKLTYAKDKLVALSAVMNLIQNTSGYQFVAGLWRERLLYELLWFVYVWSVKSSLFPSWSWASSTQSPIHFVYSHDEPKLRPTAQILDIRSWKVVGENSVEEHGSIRIRCVLWRAQSDKDYPFDLTVNGDGRRGFTAAAELDIESIADIEVYAIILLSKPQVWVPYLVPVQKYQIPAAGLVVRRVSTREHIYERVGMWIMRKRHGEFPPIYRSDYRDITLV